MKKQFRILLKTIKITGIIIAATIVFLLAMPFVCYDISTEKLGPSPYKVDESIASEENAEFNKLLEIGQEIQGFDEFEEAYKFDLNNPQPTFLLLQTYLKKNEGVIEKINFKLFENCKFPKADMGPNAQNFDNLRKILKLLQRKITLNILSNDFEKAKTDLIFTNQICSELFKKTTGFLSSIMVFGFKRDVIDNINLILRMEHFSIDQKIEILNINQEKVPTQVLRNTIHFECKATMKFIMDLKTVKMGESTTLGGTKYYAIISPFVNQPNKTGKRYREMASKILLNLEIGKEAKKIYPSILSEVLNVDIKPEAIFGNYSGIFAVDRSEPFIRLISSKILNCNSNLAQLSIAKDLLIYKKTKSVLPNNLAELNIEKKLYTYYDTGESFLYFAPNGILQNKPIEWNKEIQSLTSKALSLNEINSALTSALTRSSLFIIHLN